jgi:cysteine-S-conjugate beta-lyase
MTSFDFDQPIERRGTGSVKWDIYTDPDCIAMWVADMDFQSPPAVIAALQERVAHGVFGYTMAPEALAETVIARLEKLYNWTVEKEWLIWLPGLVSGINVTCRAVGEPGDAVVTTVPIYPPFLSAPGNSNRTVIKVPMVLSENRWHVDLEAFEASLTPRAKLFLLCSPHNPTGRLFTASELQGLAGICERHDVVICSDEIHHGLVLDEDKPFIPTASLSPAISDRTITLIAPSKTYNLPGFGCSLAIIENRTLRKRFRKAMAGIVPHGNALGYTAALAAYRHGDSWLEALIPYLCENRDLLQRAIQQLPGLTMTHVEATYLAWIDVRETGIANPAKHFEAHGVGLSDGREFDGDGWVRLNFACPRSILRKGLARMEKALKSTSEA